jgi:hypothetical protein
MSLASASFAVPEKIFHLSSWRALTGLRSDNGFCCATGGVPPSPGATAAGIMLVLAAASIASIPRATWFGYMLGRENTAFRRSLFAYLS